jgi:hypothetical protein
MVVSTEAFGEHLTRCIGDDEASVAGTGVSMKYVVVRRTQDGYWLDPTAYLAALPSFAEQLPPGARAFAEDAGHYNIGDGSRCVKDLWFASLTVGPPGGTESVTIQSATIRFDPNAFKHDVGLTLVYSGANALSVSVGTYGKAVMLDELLPTEHGFSHEITLTSDASITVAAADLDARWE